jgi:hypothetical protein
MNESHVHSLVEAASDGVVGSGRGNAALYHRLLAPVRRRPPAVRIEERGQCIPMLGMVSPHDSPAPGQILDGVDSADRKHSRQRGSIHSALQWTSWTRDVASVSHWA